MGQAIQVQEGQYYAKVFDGSGCGMLWKVKSVSARFLSLPHARLVNQEDPRDIRMISCDAITDGQFFKLVSEPQRQNAPQDEAAKTEAARTDDKPVKKPRDDRPNRDLRERKSVQRQIDEVEHALAQI